MFLSDDDALIAKVAEKYHLDPIDREAFKLYVKLGANDRKVLISFSFSLAQKILENPVMYREYKQARGELPKLSQADIEVEVAAYRDELQLLAKAQADEEDMEVFAEKAKNLAMDQRSLEEKPDKLASSANEFAAG